MVQDVFLDKTITPELKQLDRSRKSLFKRTTTIETTDLGAGAGNKLYVTVLSPLGKLARQRSLDKKNLYLLYKLVKYFQPNYILELGTSAGISTSYIGISNTFKKFVTMEGCAVLASHARSYLNALHLKTIEIKVGNFDVILDNTLKEFEQLDLVFVDGNHRKHQTIKYFESCLKKANDNSIFIFDDIHWSSGMAEAWQLIKENKRVTLSLDLFKIGIVFFRKEMVRQHLVIRY